MPLHAGRRDRIRDAVPAPGGVRVVGAIQEPIAEEQTVRRGAETKARLLTSVTVFSNTRDTIAPERTAGVGLIDVNAAGAVSGKRPLLGAREMVVRHLDVEGALQVDLRVHVLKKMLLP